jgi:glycosyltransferase involved in cell wall biosynthesis
LNVTTPESCRGDLTWDALSIAVPVYSRPTELRELLRSINEMAVLPKEVVLCEDKSPDRYLISQLAAEWKSILALKGCDLKYVENKDNLGYDGNVRSLFATATRNWVMLLGNDDVVLPEAIPAIQQFVAEHPKTKLISRSFVRFSEDRQHPLGISRQAEQDRVYAKNNSDAGMLFRLCGFVGGLIVDRQWALRKATDKYDGTLYYQIYLAALAFSQEGIGYIASPIVGARVGNSPLFGSASAEKGTHVPGSYTPKGRAAMWHGVLRICADVEETSSVSMLKQVRRELSGRQSFHVFEMMANQGRRATLSLGRELFHIGLMRHPFPWIVFLLAMIFGRHSNVFFTSIRAGLQK